MTILMEKADLSKGYQNPKRKLGVTMHFSEIIFIELKLGKNAIHSLYFKASLEPGFCVFRAAILDRVCRISFKQFGKSFNVFH